MRAVLAFLLLTTAAHAGQTFRVADDAALRAAIRKAQPGDTIRIASGAYAPGVWIENLHGTAQSPIVIEGDPQSPPEFLGGNEGWHLSDCSHVTLRRLVVGKQKSNGINIDDGGSFDTPAHHIRLEHVRVFDIGPEGNFDGIKLSGLDDFAVVDCTVEGWGGQAVDMVGCHRGTIERCVFRGKPGFSQHTGPQTKGGSSEIVLRDCTFDRAGSRPVQLGGSTGLTVFRPQGALYEAKDITVENCLFLGGDAAVACTGLDGGVFRHNTIVRPTKWIMRILQETTLPGFAPCRNMRFERNLIVYRRGDLQTIANVGPNTRPETFAFRENWWYCEDRPAARPDLPAKESDGVYGVDPHLDANHRPAPAAAQYGRQKESRSREDK